MLAWIFGDENQPKIRYRAIRKVYEVLHRNQPSMNLIFILAAQQRTSIFEKWQVRMQKFYEKYRRIHLFCIRHTKWWKMNELLGMQAEILNRIFMDLFQGNS